MTSYDYHYDLNDLFICRELLYEGMGLRDSINELPTTIIFLPSFWNTAELHYCNL